MTSIGLLRDKLRARGTNQVAAIPADSIQLDRLMAFVACLITFGLFIDGWAHNHGQVDDSFFTPWHALLYGAVALSGLILIVTHMRNVGKGFRFGGALPAGYTLSLLGFFMFAAGGVADLVWHEVFGFEEGLESLISPSHLFLAVSGLLIMTGPIRAAWQRKSGETWGDLLPAILAFTCITSIFLFFVAFAAITSDTALLTGPRPSDTDLIDGLGIIAFMLHSNIFAGCAAADVAALAAAGWHSHGHLRHKRGFDDLAARGIQRRVHLCAGCTGGRRAGRLAAAARRVE